MSGGKCDARDGWSYSTSWFCGEDAKWLMLEGCVHEHIHESEFCDFHAAEELNYCADCAKAGHEDVRSRCISVAPLPAAVSS